jgi:hypothetical protein
VAVRLTPTRSDGGSIEILVPGARRVRVGSDFDAAALASVLKVLESLPC